MMDNKDTLKYITVSNFKSLKSVTLDECRRINVLIGRPNVGKSNILEALALFDVPYLTYAPNKSLRQLVRSGYTGDIFHNGGIDKDIKIESNLYAITLRRTVSNGLSMDLRTYQDSVETQFNFNPTLTLTTKKIPDCYPSILAYFFPKQIHPESANLDYLLPPSGQNLMEVVAHLPKLKSQLADLLRGYGLKMVFDTGSQEIKAMRENGLDMFLVPFTSLADTFQRFIFYKAAIESNHYKVLCFEEPEAHTFPPYISNVIESVLQSQSNQFFITTHSPYVLSSLLESAGEDLAIYVIDMAEGETVVRRLSDYQLQETYDAGIDIFYNIETYLS